MRRAAIFFLCAVLASAWGCAVSEEARLKGSTTPGVASGKIYVADMGRGRVLVTDETRGLEGASDFWAPAEASDLTPDDKALFPPNEMNECKPAVFRGTRVVLATAWPSGFAVLRASDAKVLFVAEAPRGVHSAEALPDGNLVTASSTGGDCVKVYSTVTGKAGEYPLPGGHGVVWEKRTKTLWALGTDVLQHYSYNFDRGNPALTLVETFALPAPGGHDLYPRAWKDELFVTAGKSVWTFSTRDRAFTPFEPLARAEDVKSISEKRHNGRVLYTPWGNTLSFVNPPGESTKAGANIYKARSRPAARDDIRLSAALERLRRLSHAAYHGALTGLPPLHRPSTSRITVRTVSRSEESDTRDFFYSGLELGGPSLSVEPKGLCTPRLRRDLECADV